MEVSIDQLLDNLNTHSKYMTEEQVVRLAWILTQLREEAAPTEAPTGGETLTDLLKEIQEQMTFLKNFRKQIVAKGDTASTREVKDMIQASTSLFTMLTKMNEDITNQDRLRKIENATVNCIKTLPLKVQQKFFADLEEALAR